MRRNWVLDHGYFVQVAHFLVGYETRDSYKMTYLANPNRGHSHYPRDFWSSYEYLIHFQSEDNQIRHVYLDKALMRAFHDHFLNIMEHLC